MTCPCLISVARPELVRRLASYRATSSVVSSNARTAMRGALTNGPWGLVGYPTPTFTLKDAYCR
jgi:hypothetical protein